MENRFTARDFLMMTLSVATIVVVLLVWVNFDRKWDRMVRIDENIARQQEQISRLRTVFETLEHQIEEAVVRIESIEWPEVGTRQVDPNGPIGNGEARNGTGAQTGTGETRVEPSDRGTRPRVTPRQAHSHDRLRRVRRMEGYREGETLTQVMHMTVGKLTPLVATDAYQSEIEGWVIESLADRDPETLEWSPLIAESWDISEDGLVYTFRMRRDVRFSDGSPLTARDVVYTYDLIMNPRIDTPRSRSYYERFESVTALDDFTVEFRLRDYYFLAFQFAAGMGILSEKYYSQFTEEEFNQSRGLLFGSGPYRLAVDPEDWRPGRQRIELVRNDLYWGPRPTFDRVVWREILEDTARSIAFTNRETDVHAPLPREFVRTKDSRSVREIANVFEFDSPTAGYRYIGWNFNDRDGNPGRFNDRRVRQAMTMLINRQEMADRINYGLATVSAGPFHFMGPQANPDIRPWPHDVERARRLLEEAGYTRGRDGILVDAEGRPFRFSLSTASGSPVGEEQALYIRDALAQVGIDMRVDLLEWSTLLSRINERNFDAIMLGWTGGIETDPNQIFHSSQIEDGGSNAISYSNPDLDALIEQARATVDENERMKVWHKVHAILHEDQPYTFLTHPKTAVFINRRVQNVEKLRVGLTPRQEWFIDAGATP
ncbi:MAG: peptide-binding protein [Phycisphaeraceae bacterium]|nr:peptide-binding protein [Phycisphaeraceae bacterium]